MLQKGPPLVFWRKPELTQTGYNEFRILRILHTYSVSCF